MGRAMVGLNTNKLNELILKHFKKHNSNLKEISSGIGINYNNLRQYRFGMALPNVLIALKISKFFNVGVEDIWG